MRKLKFSQKLWIPLIVSLMALMVVSVFNAYQIRQVRVDERKTLLISVTTQAINLAKQYDDLAKAGVMTIEEAKKRALEQLRAMRYDQTGYFTITDAKNVVLAHPSADVVGLDATGFKDIDGKQVIVDANIVSKNPAGVFYQYKWPRIGEKIPVRKVALAHEFTPWHWFFSTGAYMDDLDAAFVRSLYAALALFLPLALVLVGLSLALNRSLLKALGGDPVFAAAVVNRMAAGDLTQEVMLRPNDNSSLLYAMSRLRHGLITIISGIQESATTVSSAASQIASGNMDLSQRSEHHASSIQETAASLEDLSTTVKNNADNARQANQMAVAATDVAVGGGDVVDQVVLTMGSINESSRKVVDIIGVIDDIAFQTNILALNAAVEAARAGEQGRGFAVVASEVRGLAQRSAAAAKEIKILITDSVEQVSLGSRLVERAGDTMSNVVENVKQVTAIVSEISAASQNQRTGIEGVHRSITQMDNVTQQNTALVQQAAAASQSLQEQAGKLIRVISVFKLKHT